MKKHLVIFGIVILFLCIGLSGCGEESSKIDITIESYYGHVTSGYITVDGIRFYDFSIDIFDKLKFQVDKSELPNQQFHTVTIYTESFIGGSINASCDEVTKSTTFMLGSVYALSCTNYQ